MAVIDLTLDDIYDAVHSFVINVLELEADKVVRAYQDNVPTPFPYPFVYMTVKNSIRNSTNAHAYNTTESLAGIAWSAILDVQLDFYGQDSMDQAQVLSGLFRDEYSVDFFKEKGLVPLYADEVLQSGSEDEKGNFMVRNTLSLHFNIHPQTEVAQDFFEELEIAVKNAEILD